jgi:hypothetical protein
MITARDQICRDAVADTESKDAIDECDKILTLEPLPLNEVRCVCVLIASVLIVNNININYYIL